MNATSAQAPVTVLVLTFNEERNIADCLSSVAGWVERSIVIDSGSTDRTVELARSLGAEVLTHRFESHSLQWKWALESAHITSPWVLAIDADQRVSPELRDNLIATLASATDKTASVVAYYLNRRQIFRGRWIRHGGYYPKYLLKLFRAGHGDVDQTDLVDHHFRVQGPVGYLQGDLIEDNRNEASIYEWIAKHNRYACRQAEEEIARESAPRPGRLVGHADERILWLKRAWSRLPLYVRPFLYFFYRYVIRLGFLDGKQGLIFHFMQALWYRLLIDVNLDELRKASDQKQAGDHQSVGRLSHEP